MGSLTMPAIPVLRMTMSVVEAAPTSPAIGLYSRITPVIVNVGFVADSAADVGRTVTGNDVPPV